MALITQAEFARQLEVSKPYIHKLVKKGIIKLRNGKVDTEQALAAMKANADPANALREESPSEVIPAGGNAAGAVDFVTARTMREAFKAKLAKLEYEEKSGKLTNAGKVKNDAFKAGRIIRDELLAIPDRLADVLAAEDDPNAVRKIIFDELELVLNRISKQVMIAIPNNRSPYLEGFFKGLKPDTRLTVSEWADQKRVLPAKATKEAGRWRTARTPYLKEIMDCLSPSSPVEQVVFMKGAQDGGTECGNNWLGYVIDHTPGPMMYVLPTLDLAKRTSKQRIAPMIDEMPDLRDKVRDPRSRDSGNTLLTKEFPNGVLIFTGANSAAGLRSMPVRFLFLDEIDAYDDDVEGEGSPINLAIKRTATFSRNRKILMVSTPNIAETSKIEPAYENSDKRRYHVPCNACGHLQPIVWAQIRFDDNDPSTTRFECVKCGHKHFEKDKPKLLSNGEWIAEGEKSTRVAGFHLSSLYSPNGWYSWQNAVEDFLEAKKNPIQFKDWTNTVVGETWTERGETVEHALLYQRREHYPAEVPWWVEILTIGCDVQDDRIEFEVTGWGANEESWSIDYVRLYGDLSRPEIWNALGEMFHRTYTRQDGVRMNVAQICMDSGGHYTDEVYAFCRKYGADWVIPIKGASQAGKPIATYPKTKNKKGVYLTLIGTDTAKELIYQRYRILEPGAGYCHWPIKDCFDEDYFKQATAKEKIKKYKFVGLTH